MKDDSIQILTKPLGVSLFGRQLKKSHLLTSPYIIPKVKKRKLYNIQSILNNEPINVDESTIVDVDLMRRANNPIFQSEFEQWYRNEIIVGRPIKFGKEFFETLLCDNKSEPLGWL